MQINALLKYHVSRNLSCIFFVNWTFKINQHCENKNNGIEVICKLFFFYFVNIKIKVQCSLSFVCLHKPAQCPATPSSIWHMSKSTSVLESTTTVVVIYGQPLFYIEIVRQRKCVLIMKILFTYNPIKVVNTSFVSADNFHKKTT